MLDSEHRSEKLGTQGGIRLSNRTAIVVALISAATAMATLVINYWLIERVRSDISEQTLALERIKLDISTSAQKTAESVAKTDAARLDLERQNALMSAKIDTARLDLEQHNASINQRIETTKTRIEDKKTRTDEVRLTQDFSKLSNDLRPNIGIECYSKVNQPSFLKVSCKFQNHGAHRCKITPLHFNILDGASERLVDKAVDQVEHSDPNTILPGGIGSNTYNIWLTSSGEKMTSRAVQIEFWAVTDKQAIEMTRRLSAGYITDAELQDLSQQNYTANLFLN
jgi:hypothetical protein